MKYRLPTPVFLGFPDKLLVKNSPAMQETLVRFLGWEGPLEKRWATHCSVLGLPGGSAGKEPVCNAGDLDSIPGLERSMEEGMATHSSILPGEIPWTEEPGGLQSRESKRVRHN